MKLIYQSKAELVISSCPGKFSVPVTESRNSLVQGTVPKVESRNPLSRKSESRSLSPIPDFSILSPGLEYRILKMGSGSRFPGPGLRDPGDPVLDADPCSFSSGRMTMRNCNDWKYLSDTRIKNHENCIKNDFIAINETCVLYRKYLMYMSLHS